MTAAFSVRQIAERAPICQGTDPVQRQYARGRCIYNHMRWRNLHIGSVSRRRVLVAGWVLVRGRVLVGHRMLVVAQGFGQNGSQWN